MKGLLIVVLVFVLMLAGCSLGGASCENYVADLQPILDRWDDANQLAGTTSRIALAGPIATLQEVRREARELEAPACAAEVDEQLMNYMEATINSYLAFAGQDESTAALQIELAATYRQNFVRELSKIQTE